jgi:hypothetical protein
MSADPGEELQEPPQLGEKRDLACFLLQPIELLRPITPRPPPKDDGLGSTARSGLR